MMFNADRTTGWRRALIVALLACAAQAAAAAPGFVPPTAAERAAAMPANYPQLVKLFDDWRAFAQPTVTNGVADYSAAAMARQAAALPAYRTRLAAIDQAGWPETARVDARFIAAEMNGLDFFQRVLACNQLFQFDPKVKPTNWRCATVTKLELEQLRRIPNIVRMGHVDAVAPGEMRLKKGVYKTAPKTLYIDCAADGLKNRPEKKVFEGNRPTTSIRPVAPVCGSLQVWVRPVSSARSKAC